LQIPNYGLRISAVVTQPPKPIGRKQIITPTPVEVWAKDNTIPVLSFPSDTQKPWLYKDEGLVADTLAPFKADLLLSASYGQKIPNRTIREARYGGVNIHPSSLPRWRGADPVPWAILSGDHQIGVTIVTVTEEFDGGKILAQHKIPIGSDDFSDPLRSKLFTLGAELLSTTLSDFLAGSLKGAIQDPKKITVARRFTRDDGLIPWETLRQAITDGTDAIRIERTFRALSPWPGLWTEIETRDKKPEIRKTKRRVKILACHLSHDSSLTLDSVQLEGKKPVSWKQFASAYPAHAT